MGVIIDGNERKSIAEQVEENSKYKGKLVYTTNLKIYKKDLPCFVRIMIDYLDEEDELKIYKGSGSVVWKTMATINRKLDLFIRESETNSNYVKVWEVSGDTLIASSWTYGNNNQVLSAKSGYDNSFMVIPLKYVYGG